MGESEFVFACKGRPFCVLTAAQFPTPAFTMVDHRLVRELGLTVTDLQCVKMRYGGQNLRILGKISTSVQCIVDGAPVGNMHLKAHVVTDVYQLFNTYAIAGVKLADKLTGKPNEAEESITEPTKHMKRKRKKKFKGTEGKNISETSDDASETGTDATPARPMTSLFLADVMSQFSPPWSSQQSGSPPRPPSPLVQGKWLMKFRCSNPRDPSDFEPYYVDRLTGKEQDKTPDSWNCNGSMYSYHSDEYDDVYTNESTVIKVPKDDTCDNTDHQADQQITHADKRQDVLTTMVYTVGPAEARGFSQGLLAKRRMHFNLTGDCEPIPDHLKDVPLPHGHIYCNGECLWVADVPLECGYNTRHGRFYSCCQRCPGAWCGHSRTAGEGIFLGSKESRGTEE